MIGKIVNFRYEVLEKIGDGPLFSVFKSRDKVLNRLVALKTPNRAIMDAPGFSTALVISFKEMAALAHPNIARVLDADCVGGECFIASEFARGINVKERIRRAGPVSAPLAVDIIIPVLTALEYAHSMGVYHGDLAAQDIIVSPDGEVKVTDFGLARVLSGNTAAADRATMRSVHYQAPEITEGANPSAASDIYSVGVILYEMLTGQLPFEGGTAIAVALKKMKDTPANPRTINTAVPKSLSDIAMRAIEPAPKDRYPSVAAMLAELKAVSEALRTGIPASSSAYLTKAQVARKAEEVEADLPERSFRSQYLIYLGLFILFCALFMFGTFMLQKQEQKIAVPPLLGMTMDQAQYEARKAGITLIDDGTRFSDEFSKGQICSVNPPANEMVPASNPVVKVKTSSGPSQVRVPDVVGKSEPDAMAAIAAAGFIPKTGQENSEKVPTNMVISQDPPAGTRQTPGGTIDIVISLGPKPQDDNPPSTTGTDTTSLGQSQVYKVKVEVPADADGSQEVKIVVSDDRGETTVYDKQHEPGDSFTERVTTYGSSVQINTYVGGELVSSETP